MKKNYFFIAVLTGSIGLLAFQKNTFVVEKTAYKNSHLAFSGGAPAGRTGAPGEINCTTSGCHDSGSAQDGTGFQTIIISDGGGAVTEYTPNATYTIAITMTTANPKNGFEIVSLDGSNAQAGTVTITNTTATQSVNGSAGKKYVTHKTAGNTLNTWSYSWTAPATNVGDVTFYLATNESNSSGSDQGDIIRLSNTSIGSTAGIKEKQSKLDLSVGFNTNLNTLLLNMNTTLAGETMVNLVDLNGKSVFVERLGETEIGENQFSVKLPNELNSGIYVVNVNVNNEFTSKKISISK